MKKLYFSTLRAVTQEMLFLLLFIFYFALSTHIYQRKSIPSLALRSCCSYHENARGKTAHTFTADKKEDKTKV